MEFVSFDIPGENMWLSVDEAQRLFAATSIGGEIAAGATVAISHEQARELIDRIERDANPSADAYRLNDALTIHSFGGAD